MLNRRHILVAMLAGAGWTTIALGQTAGYLNRAVEAIAVTPEPGTAGLYRIDVAWTNAADVQTTETVNLNTDIEIFVNGIPSGVAAHNESHLGPISCESVCDPSCNYGRRCAKRKTGFGCICKNGSTRSFDQIPLSSGDQITAVVSVGPGGFVEGDTSDDSLTITFAGDQIGWNRRVNSVTLLPTPGAPDGTYDIHIAWSSMTRGIEGDDFGLSAEVQVSVNGVPAGLVTSERYHDLDINDLCYHPAPQSDDDCLGGSCGLWSDDINDIAAFPLECVLFHPVEAPPLCWCEAEASIVVPGLTLSEGDEVGVQLVPLPGTPAELGGLTYDDTASATLTTTCGDFDGDGDVDTIDFTVFVQCFGGSNNPPAPTCPPGVDADCDNDGDVDVADFLDFGQNFTGSL